MPRPPPPALLLGNTSICNPAETHDVCSVSWVCLRVFRLDTQNILHRCCLEPFWMPKAPQLAPSECMQVQKLYSALFKWVSSSPILYHRGKSINGEKIRIRDNRWRAEVNTTLSRVPERILSLNMRWIALSICCFGEAQQCTSLDEALHRNPRYQAAWSPDEMLERSRVTPYKNMGDRDTTITFVWWNAKNTGSHPKQTTPSWKEQQSLPCTPGEMEMHTLAM